MTAAAAPIFIVGCQRSGTTVLRLILDSHGDIACGPETRFLRDWEKITGEDWHRIERFGFPREVLAGQGARLLRLVPGRVRRRPAASRAGPTRARCTR